MKRLFPAFAIAITCFSCANRSYTDQGNVINVDSLVEGVGTSDALISNNSNIYVFGERLYIVDNKPHDKVLHVFDVNDGMYLGSAISFGPSPEEISIPDALGVNTDTGDAIMFDFGQNRIVSFNVDSILANDSCAPRTMVSLNPAKFPSHYIHVNDTTGYCRMIVPTPEKSYTQKLARYNIKTGDVTEFSNCDAVADNNKSKVAVAPDGKKIIEACRTQELIVIYDDKGNPVKEVKGQNYLPEADNMMSYFTGATVTDRHILAAYSGKNARKHFYGNYIVVFDLDGNYITTLDTGVPIIGMAYSPTNRNLYISTPDSIQFC